MTQQAYIKRLKENELLGGTDETDVYPVTHIRAVYDATGKNLEQLMLDINQQLKDLSASIDNALAGIQEINDKLAALVPEGKAVVLTTIKQ